MGRPQIAALGAALTLAVSTFAAGPDPHAQVRGMTVSCPRSGQIWGTDEMVEAMVELKRLGVNWISIHPYAPIGANGAVGGRRSSSMYAEPSWPTQPIAEAHRLGLKIMVKPHLAYWGSPFQWRGEIGFDSDQEWRRFFDSYREWIARVAELAKDADAFAVGTELDATVLHEGEWRRIIKAVREQTNAPLTYSANWNAYDRVGFWDALDVIGVQAYFPIVEHRRVPTEKELDRGWQRWLDELDVYANRHGRRVVFGELGYNRSADAARRPWGHGQGGDGAELVQERSLRAALRAIERSDVIVGAFLWKWFPGTHEYENFLKSTPAMRRVIGDHWRGSTP